MSKIDEIKDILKVASSVEGLLQNEPLLNATAEHICQLFELKLPENPYPETEPTESLSIALENLRTACHRQAFNEALQAVKELNNG